MRNGTTVFKSALAQEATTNSRIATVQMMGDKRFIILDRIKEEEI